MDMAKSPKARRASASFTVPTKVEIRQPEFQPLSCLAALDTERLSKGDHTLEIGFVRGGCCPQLVRAVVKNGMVTGCEVEPCKSHSAKEPPRELLAVLEKARRKIQAGKKWRPIPVADLFRNNAIIRDLVRIFGGCITICVWGHCLWCCATLPPFCVFDPDIATGPLE